jgi:glutathione S-transferase
MGCGASSIPPTDTIEVGRKGPERQADIVSYSYFPTYGRGSKLGFAMELAKIQFEFKPIPILAWVNPLGGNKAKYGGMPFCIRSDGGIMRETDPILRYICRHNNMYPSNPLDAYKNDFLVEKYQKFFNDVHLCILTFGAESKKNRANSVAKIIPEWLEMMKPYYCDGWVVGDGSTFYMADFYVGTIWTDVINNPGSWLTSVEQDAFKKQFPEFAAYGKRFDGHNQSFLNKRQKMYGGPPAF